MDKLGDLFLNTFLIRKKKKVNRHNNARKKKPFGYGSQLEIPLLNIRMRNRSGNCLVIFFFCLSLNLI